MTCRVSRDCRVCWGMLGLQGCWGYAGFAGLLGYAGFAGLLGYAGYAGFAGFAGVCWVCWGMLGLQGSWGMLGLHGSWGMLGLHGSWGMLEYAEFAGVAVIYYSEYAFILHIRVLECQCTPERLSHVNSANRFLVLKLSYDPQIY